ncbi:TIGR03905 family TSCPD domain-containing protein [uncultured Fusobacterium sp.]|uniref:TIGR03905 family TSCPD domain-containing protein n=1 Tax=uncultured Fusobacterium sp. TaxID=159267 RepID=UPI0025EE92B3|nr:TIGR03905 family TSCPD domain-containing protein [uncultured Fusobacterium sp.]
MKYYRTQRICAKEIGVELDENNIIREVEFCGGCEGNTQGLQNLLVGMNKEDVIKKLQGINCGRKGTSCPDQLAQILKSL